MELQQKAIFVGELNRMAEECHIWPLYDGDSGRQQGKLQDDG